MTPLEPPTHGTLEALRKLRWLTRPTMTADQQARAVDIDASLRSAFADLERVYPERAALFLEEFEAAGRREGWL